MMAFNRLIMLTPATRQWIAGKVVYIHVADDKGNTLRDAWVFTGDGGGGGGGSGPADSGSMAG